MADRIELREGSAPWRPTPDSEVVAMYRYCDAPLAGVVSQHGNEYLFWCLDGELDTLSLWFFASITADQRERLEATPIEDFYTSYMQEPLRGCITLAFATERLGIVDTEAVEDDDDDAVMAQRLQDALTQLRNRLAELNDDAARLELSLA